MLGAVCPQCGPVLVWESRIRALDNTPSGIIVRFRCLCGHEGQLITGRRARPA